jgi:precorrin-3B methylase
MRNDAGMGCVVAREALSARLDSERPQVLAQQVDAYLEMCSWPIANPVVIGRNVSGPDEEVRVVRLADLDAAEVDMRCLLIVGSSQTQWYSDDFGDRVFTPRRYPV